MAKIDLTNVSLTFTVYQQKRVTLTRQDWRGPRAGWGPKSVGHWEVAVAHTGRYRLVVRFDAAPADTTVTLKVQGPVTIKVNKGEKECRVDRLALEEGPARLEAWVGDGQGSVGVHQVDVERLD